MNDGPIPVFVPNQHSPLTLYAHHVGRSTEYKNEADGRRVSLVSDK